MALDPCLALSRLARLCGDGLASNSATLALERLVLPVDLGVLAMDSLTSAAFCASPYTMEVRSPNVF